MGKFYEHQLTCARGSLWWNKIKKII